MNGHMYMLQSRCEDSKSVSCSSLYFIAQGAGFSVAGRIESGHLQQGDSVLVLPANEVANIKGKYFRLSGTFV